MYTIRFLPEAMEAFRRIPSGIVGYVNEAIQQLRRNPRPSDAQLIFGDFYRISAYGHIVEYEMLEREVVIRIVFVQ